MREGKSLSEAVEEAGVFSKVYSTAILAGEKSGNLSGVLDYYIAYQKVSTGVKKKIVASLVYPTLLVIVATIHRHLPGDGGGAEICLLYRDLGVQLPGPTQFADHRYGGLPLLHSWGASALFLLSVVGMFLWSRSDEGGVAFDRLLFRMPILGDTLLKFQVAAILPHAGHAADRRNAAGRGACHRGGCHYQQIVRGHRRTTQRKWCAKANRFMARFLPDA